MYLFLVEAIAESKALGLELGSLRPAAVGGTVAPPWRGDVEGSHLSVR